ncbi:hypothetical protein RHGRI_011199 [Rhododendron griersonianum]|uniref:Uncharacterized protein n=1 Tax=Rhododendron griersonianum TaxID=479676 RepID=A0AAV6KLZ1_9ERIC|nr:hypothetical protein RHGRI_011199 [Rhododendron griersonianum]
MGALKTSTGVLSTPARVPIATGGGFCTQQIWSKAARVWYTAEGGGSPDIVGTTAFRSGYTGSAMAIALSSDSMRVQQRPC